MAATRAARERAARRRETTGNSAASGIRFARDGSLWSDSDRRAANVVSSGGGARRFSVSDSDSDATPVPRRRAQQQRSPSPEEAASSEHNALSAELVRLQGKLAARSAASPPSAAAVPLQPLAQQDRRHPQRHKGRRHDDREGARRTGSAGSSDAHDASELLAEAQRLSEQLASDQQPSPRPRDAALGQKLRAANRTLEESHRNLRQGRVSSPVVAAAADLHAQLADAEQRASHWAGRTQSAERSRVEAEAEAEAWKMASLEAEAKAEAWRTASLAAEDAAQAAAAAQAEAEEETLTAQVTELEAQNGALLAEALAHAQQLQQSEAKLREEAAARDEEIEAMRDAMRAAQALSDGAEMATTELANMASELKSVQTENVGLNLAVTAATEMATSEREVRLQVQAAGLRASETSGHVSDRVAGLEASLTAAGVARKALEQWSAAAEGEVVTLRAATAKQQEELAAAAARVQMLEQQYTGVQAALVDAQLQLKQTLDPMKLEYVKTQDRILELEEQLEVERRQAEGAVLAATQAAREAAMADAAAELQMLAQRVQDLSTTCLELEESRHRGAQRQQQSQEQQRAAVKQEPADEEADPYELSPSGWRVPAAEPEPAPAVAAATRRRMLGAGGRLYADGVKFAAIRLALIQEHGEEAWNSIEDDLRQATGEPQRSVSEPAKEDEPDSAMQQASVELSQRFPQCSAYQVMATLRRTGGNVAQAREVLRFRGYEEAEEEAAEAADNDEAAAAEAAAAEAAAAEATAEAAAEAAAGAAAAEEAALEAEASALRQRREEKQRADAEAKALAAKAAADAEARYAAADAEAARAMAEADTAAQMRASVASESEDPFAQSARTLAAPASPTPLREKAPPAVSSSPARVKLANLTIDGSLSDGMFVAAFGAETASLQDRIAAWASPRMADADLTNVSELVGKVVIVARGGVPAVQKARRVQNAGAVACIIVNADDKSWRPGGHMPAGAAQADVGADITIPVIVVPLSAASAFGSGGGKLSLEYGKADTPSMTAKSLFKTAGRALALRSAVAAGSPAQPLAERPLPKVPAQRMVPTAFGDESPGGAAGGAASF